MCHGYVLPIGDILKIKSGFGFKASEYCDFGAKLLQIENVGYGKINWNSDCYLPFDYLDKYPELHLKENDIVIALNRPVTNNQLKISKISTSDTPSILYQRVGKICLIKESIQSDYIFQVFNIYVKNFVLKQAIGSDQPFISITSLYKYRIPLPAFPEQTKIANFLTAIDEKITQLTQKCDLLTQYKKGVMQQIFSQKLRFKDDDGQEFPEWEEMPLSHFLIPIVRKISKPENLYLAIGIRSHFKGTFQKHDSEPEKIAMEDLYQVKPNDLIVNITFAWEGAVAIAKDKDAGGLVSHRFPTFEFNEKYVKSDFFRFAYPTNHFKYLLGLCSPGGAGRNRVLNKNDFLKIELQIPCLTEQTKIANFLTAIDDKITQAQTQLEAVKHYKKGLLQQMFV